MKNLKVVSIVLVLLIMGFFLSHIALAFKRKLEADTAFNRFGNAVQMGKYQDAYAFTDSRFRSVTTFEDFTSQLEDMHKELGRLQEVRRAYSSANRFGFTGPWHASETSEFVYERGVVKVTFEMENETSRWLIRGYRRTE